MPHIMGKEKEEEVNSDLDWKIPGEKVKMVSSPLAEGRKDATQQYVFTPEHIRDQNLVIVFRLLCRIPIE